MNQTTQNESISEVEVSGMKAVNLLEYVIYVGLLLILLTSISFDVASVLFG